SEPKTERRKDEPMSVTHCEIAMISGGIPEEGNPPSKKAAKRSRHSCLAVEVMPRPLTGKPPPTIVFSSEEIMQTTNSMNQPLVIFASTINTKIRRVFVDQGSSADILSTSKTPRTQEREGPMASSKPQFRLQCDHREAYLEQSRSDCGYIYPHHEIHN
ncbi:hypothetical protein PIB30_095487, partial [Stylosanthes scabra]|nr:hypothetical protein [Stylosanthes scabra]